MDNILPEGSNSKSAGRSSSYLPLALVTGAAKRIGRLIALHLASRGFAIALHYHRSEDDAVQTAREIEQMGVPVLLLQADLTDPESVSEMFRVIEGTGRPLKLLVNSAAIMRRSNLLDIGLNDWDKIFDLNTRAVWQCSRDAARRMVQGGVILNISDVGARKNWTGFGAYVVSKAAVEALTRVMARQLAPRVRVCAIAPGLLLPAEDQSLEDWQALIEKVPLGRPADLAEFLALLDFLIDNDYITGEVITLSGGYQLV